jgi:hypothetical protein
MKKVLTGNSLRPDSLALILHPSAFILSSHARRMSLAATQPTKTSAESMSQL